MELRRVFKLRRIFKSRRVSRIDFIFNILESSFLVYLLFYDIAYINLLCYSVALIYKVRIIDIIILIKIDEAIDIKKFLSFTNVNIIYILLSILARL